MADQGPESGSGAKRGLVRERLLIYLAPMLLVLIATIQHVKARPSNLTPWKGGGFGMFSSIDSKATRFVRLYLVRDLSGEAHFARATPPTKKPGMRMAMDEVRTIPTPERVQKLANTLAASPWKIYGRPQTSAQKTPVSDPVARQGPSVPTLLLPGETGAEGPSEPARFTSVKLEVWSFTLDPVRSRLVATKLTEANASNPKP